MDLADLPDFSDSGERRRRHSRGGTLHRVQSNITTRVRQLEEDLGVALFIRAGKRLHLSPTGKVLLEYADRLLDLAQEARVAVRDNTPRGPLRLGAMESTAAIRLPAPLSEFHRRYPDVKLDLSSTPHQGAPWNSCLQANWMPRWSPSRSPTSLKKKRFITRS